MIVDHLAAVRALSLSHPAEQTVQGALAFVTELLTLLPPVEQAGYLRKTLGENILPLPDGTLVSVGRICYPDGRVYKVLSDVPATNGPQWLDEGLVDPVRYVPPVSAPPRPPPGLSIEAMLRNLSGALELATTAVTQQLGDMEVRVLLSGQENTEKIQQQIDQVVKNAEASAKRALTDGTLVALIREALRKP